VVGVVVVVGNVNGDDNETVPLIVVDPELPVLPIVIIEFVDPSVPMLIFGVVAPTKFDIFIDPFDLNDVSISVFDHIFEPFNDIIEFDNAPNVADVLVPPMFIGPTFNAPVLLPIPIDPEADLKPVPIDNVPSVCVVQIPTFVVFDAAFNEGLINADPVITPVCEIDPDVFAEILPNVAVIPPDPDVIDDDVVRNDLSNLGSENIVFIDVQRDYYGFFVSSEVLINNYNDLL
jgi:hypothetical protein